MSRVLDANMLFAGTEPSFKGIPVDEIKKDLKITLMRTLSWYSQNSDEKSSLVWLKKAYPKSTFSFAGTVGFLCRMIERGFPADILKPEIEKRLPTLEERGVKAKEAKEAKEDKPKAVPLIDPKVDEVCEQVDYAIDDFLMGKTSSRKIGTALLNTKQLREVAEYIELEKERFTGLNEVEGYENITYRKEKAITAYLGKLLDQIQGQRPVVQRKPRKVRQKPVEKIVSKFRCTDFGTFKTVDPAKLHNSSKALVFDTERRVVTLFVAEEGKFLEVKGINIINFDEEKSYGKRIRPNKLNEVLTDLSGASKAQIEKKMSAINAIEKFARKRSSETMCILKVW